MPKNATFADDIVEALRNAKILGVRAGTEHRYTGVWVVVVEGRLFVRSWNDKPTGWFHAFRREPERLGSPGKSKHRRDYSQSHKNHYLIKPEHA